MNYLELKISEAGDDLRYRLHELTLNSLKPKTTSSVIFPQPELIHGLITQYEDPYVLTANVTGLSEEWYRRGLISAMSLNNDTDLDQLFQKRNQQLIASLKEWANLTLE